MEHNDLPLICEQPYDYTITLGGAVIPARLQEPCCCEDEPELVKFELAPIGPGDAVRIDLECGFSGLAIDHAPKDIDWDRVAPE
jgi:hypothetical protein